jgi:hypothetical protein
VCVYACIKFVYERAAACDALCFVEENAASVYLPLHQISADLVSAHSLLFALRSRACAMCSGH